MDFENELVGIKEISINCLLLDIELKLQTNKTTENTFAFTLPSRQLACLVHCQLKAKQMYFYTERETERERDIIYIKYINTHVKCLQFSCCLLKAQFVNCSNQNKSRL